MPASRRFPNTAAISARVGFVVDEVAPLRVFSEYFGFPYQLPPHQLLH
jgi:hypothetical protein